jgi:hypothetical protein
METKTFNVEELRNIIRVNDTLKREGVMRSKLEGVRRKLESLVGELAQSEKVKYTGWNILLKKVDGRFEFIAIVNPDLPDQNIPEEFDIILPIPDSTTLPEFDGF